MFIFLGILILGLAYVWRKGDLDWIKPSVTLPQTDARIPQSLYDDLNTQQGNFKVKEFSLEIQAPATATSSEPRKPMFKPAFKKPANDA
jgi:NADH-quinone oxidoreductase subunit A